MEKRVIMSFFGITALGLQNPFESRLLNAIGLKLFTHEEFKSAFDRLDADHSGYIELREIRTLLEATYGMPPLDEEVDMFMLHFDENKDGKISWEEFTQAVDAMLEYLNEKAKNATEVRSFEEWTFLRRKHIRSKLHPVEKYRKPLTYGQGYGFFNDSTVRTLPTATRTFYARKKCEETKYADALIKTNYHFS